jgi:hypothetical protein
MMKSIRRIFIVLLASAGIRLDKLTEGRIDALLFIAIGYASHLLISQHITLLFALIYYFGLFAVRYIYLFASFVKHGFAGWLIEKYGEPKAWSIYELLTAVLFFQRGLSFGLLTEVSQWSVLNFVGDALLPFGATGLMIFKTSCMGVGIGLIFIGLWVNITSTFVIGIDTYYYKDLFLKRSVVDFKVEGPYKYFANPMYGIGQASGYGAALMVGSVEGLLATLLNQVVMYVFYHVIEKPHIKAMLVEA